MQARLLDTYVYPQLELKITVFNDYRPNLTLKHLLRGHTSLPGDHRELEPPDPIPNSVVKWFIADGSVGFPHVRVGHRQASKLKNPCRIAAGVFFMSLIFKSTNFPASNPIHRA
jgi:hypothetical protein